MAQPSLSPRRSKELELLEQGTVPFRRLQAIEAKFPRLDPDALQMAFQMLSIRRPWLASESDSTPANEELVGPSSSKSLEFSETLAALLKQPTAAEERRSLRALISQVGQLRARLLCLHPSTLEKLSFPKFGLAGGQLIDELSSTLAALRDGFEAAHEKLRGADSRRDRSPITQFVFTVANEVHRAGHDVSASLHGALQIVIGIILEDSTYAKDLDSSIRKALKSWTPAGIVNSVS